MEKKKNKMLNFEQIKNNFDKQITLRRYLFSMLILSIILLALGKIVASYLFMIYCFLGLTFQEGLRREIDG